jgi:hypothetical protein
MANIIYRLVNRKKENSQEYPCYYIGSKLNYVPGQYWGSSRNPVLINELKENITDFEIEILEMVEISTILTKIEKEYQIKFDVVRDFRYYNLNYAGEKFTSTGKKWFYDPNTLQKGYFPTNKAPINWLPGTKPDEQKSEVYKKRLSRNKQSKYTGFKKNDVNLNLYRSDANSRFEWTIQDPNGKIYLVTKLHRFCEEHKLPHKFRLSKKLGVPIKKGKFKGWCVIDKKIKSS